MPLTTNAMYAIPAADFQDVIMTIIFATGATVGTEECATFAIDDDNLMEPQEFFTVQATGGMFSGGQDTTQVTIADNDGKVVDH